jgi:hypothetical protein
MKELRGEFPVAVLVSAEFGKRALAHAGHAKIKLVRYTPNINLKEMPTFQEIYQSLALRPIQGCGFLTFSAFIHHCGAPRTQHSHPTLVAATRSRLASFVSVGSFFLVQVFS